MGLEADQARLDTTDISRLEADRARLDTNPGFIFSNETEFHIFRRIRVSHSLDESGFYIFRRIAVSDFPTNPVFIFSDESGFLIF